MALRIARVTPREYAVACELLADGAGNSEIGDRLGISEDTVKSHIKGLLWRTGCVTRTEVAVKVMRGIIQLKVVKRMDPQSCTPPEKSAA